MSNSDRPFIIRDARDADRSHFLRFILDLQRFEHAFEANRRLDPRVAEDYLVLLEKDVAKGGNIFVAERHGAPIGWAIVLEQDDDVYVVSEERRHAYISELFVVDGLRGGGVGRALIAACEQWALARELSVVQIGVLPGNHRAKAVYERAGYEHYAVRLRKYLNT
jgi:ribosomal protein S18 acetylase RimI-like enzyme